MFDAKKHGKAISFPDFAKRFKPRFHKPFARAQDQIEEIVVLEGKRVTIDDDLLIDHASANVVVDGDLVIDGNLVMYVGERFGAFALITGNLRAHSICLSGFPELIVRGNVTCENGIIGMRGDDGGFFDVAGKVKAPVIVADSYFNFKFKGAVSGVTINTSYRTFKARYTRKNVAEAVLPKFLDDGDEGIDSEKVFDAIEKGKSILRATKGGGRAGPARG
jgi:hypothetical protein